MIGFRFLKPGSLRHFLSVVSIAAGLLLAMPVSADPMVTAVLYPDIRDPFRTVFMSIARGIEDAGLEIRLKAVGGEENSKDVRDWLRKSGAQSVVALGSQGQRLSDELSPDFPVVIGAVHMSPALQAKRYYGISLSPDPDRLLRRLKTLAPQVTRVTLIYHKNRDYWMVENAIQPAKNLGITLNAIPVERLQEAAAKYQQVLGTLKSDTDALWLSQDSAVLDEQAVLPMILREAWDRKLIVFSSNPSHVKRGTLFAMYPDNERMGKSLGLMAISAHERGPYGIHLLEDLATAFNVRTAGHLGIPYSKESLGEFDLLFPVM
jgi:putative ABC transport system substrate-binding protein